MSTPPAPSLPSSSSVLRRLARGTLLATLLASGVACGSDAVPACPSGMDPEVCGVFQSVNRERVSRGLSAYQWDNELGDAAQLHAEDMHEQNYFSHTSLNGDSFSTRANDAGYTGSPRGENIAAGQRSAESVMDSWMNSPGHRANILAEGSNEIGIGLHNFYWVQVFGYDRDAP